MKQKDIALIVVIAILSAIISFLVSGRIFVSPNNKNQKVEVVDPISSEFKNPSEKYFNKDSIDPTQLVNIGDNNNQNPFNGQTQ